jgi:hypothetical protein
VPNSRPIGGGGVPADAAADSRMLGRV